ncbi:hypothetical protein B0J12DRAFT_667258 [Macrophomina phaseolina]|uniref:Uncharacterized protein n=1 Tax=Macrophomina phaseolina TaxID=35725 RepID=A0ABQ8G8B9_9PEZI|nr:hypothetical protein B0J12DRAFT_667258 [Macrophomina phaseolina]
MLLQRSNSPCQNRGLAAFLGAPVALFLLLLSHTLSLGPIIPRPSHPRSSQRPAANSTPRRIRSGSRLLPVLPPDDEFPGGLAGE